jgi:hypothetical protein
VALFNEEHNRWVDVTLDDGAFIGADPGMYDIPLDLLKQLAARVGLPVGLGPPVTVNGFSVTSVSTAYEVAEHQMLMHLSAHAVVSAAPTQSAAVCTLQASAANEVQNGAGLLIIWTVAPSAQFIHETSSQRLGGAQVVEQYLTSLLKSSRNLYLAALQADQVPLQGPDLASWWGVEVRSISTTGSLMTFQIATTATTSTTSWSDVPGVSSSASQAMAPEALANLLYYTKNIAVLPGLTT